MAAFAAFCIVQDLVTIAGAREYARLSRQAAEVSVEAVMAPAVRRSVWWGLAAAAVVAAGSGIIARRRRPHP
jgi:hypothetical protein